MDFEEYYKKFEIAVKKELTADLWDKSLAKGDPRDFARELFESDIGFEPDEAAEEYVAMVNTMKEQGELDEAAKPWSLEYQGLQGEPVTERFGTESEAWDRYNTLDARTKGMFADVLYVTAPVCEEGGSAASLGPACTVPLRKKKSESFNSKDLESYLHNALDYAIIGPDDDEACVKFIADEGGGFELRALMKGGTDKLLESGPLFKVVDYYRELVDSDPAEAALQIRRA